MDPQARLMPIGYSLRMNQRKVDTAFPVEKAVFDAFEFAALPSSLSFRKDWSRVLAALELPMYTGERIPTAGSKSELEPEVYRFIKPGTRLQMRPSGDNKADASLKNIWMVGSRDGGGHDVVLFSLETLPVGGGLRSIGGPAPKGHFYVLDTSFSDDRIRKFDGLPLKSGDRDGIRWASAIASMKDSPMMKMSWKASSVWVKQVAGWNQQFVGRMIAYGSRGSLPDDIEGHIAEFVGAPTFTTRSHHQLKQERPGTLVMFNHIPLVVLAAKNKDDLVLWHPGPKYGGTAPIGFLRDRGFTPSPCKLDINMGNPTFGVKAQRVVNALFGSNQIQTGGTKYTLKLESPARDDKGDSSSVSPLPSTGLGRKDDKSWPSMGFGVPDHGARVPQDEVPTEAKLKEHKARHGVAEMAPIPSSVATAARLHSFDSKGMPSGAQSLDSVRLQGRDVVEALRYIANKGGVTREGAGYCLYHLREDIDPDISKALKATGVVVMLNDEELDKRDLTPEQRDQLRGKTVVCYEMT